MRILFQHYNLYFSAGRERNALIEAIEEIDMLIVTPLFPPGFEQAITDQSLKPQVFSLPPSRELQRCSDNAPAIDRTTLVVMPLVNAMFRRFFSRGKDQRWNLICAQSWKRWR
jgi:hypothetical protein